MKHRKDLISVVGAFSLTITILIACGGNSTSSTSTEVPSVPNTPSPAVEANLSPAELISLGQEKFISCVGCHGLDGTGLPGLGKDIVSSTFAQELNDDELLTFIKTGRSASDPLNTTGLDMPPKGGNEDLSDADIRAIVAWLRSIQK